MTTRGKNYFIFVVFLICSRIAAAQEQGTVRYLPLSVAEIAASRMPEAGRQPGMIIRPRLKIFDPVTRSPKGLLLLFPGGPFDHPDLPEADRDAKFFSRNGYRVVIPEYLIAEKKPAHDLAILLGLIAFRQIRSDRPDRTIPEQRIFIAGRGNGGHIAAEIVSRLGEKEQPACLVLTDPEAMEEKIPGTVLPALRPPVHPLAHLLLVFRNSDSVSDPASVIYAKTWQGYDGPMSTMTLPKKLTSDDALPDLAILDFIAIDRRHKPETENPAEMPVAGAATERHAEKRDSLQHHSYDLLMIGNSITNNFDKPEYQYVWKQFFGSRNAINLGYSGYRTENILWNLDNGELEGQQPKVAVIEIGTNNVDEKHYPARHTAGQLAGGILAIVKRIRSGSPETKIIVLRCFPGSYDGADPTSHRAILERASEIVSKAADNHHVFYCDVNHVFLNLDGSVNHELMPDYLHPSPAGAMAWARAMEPLLSRLMEDSSRDNQKPANTAIVPATKLEEDSYSWWDRHGEVLRIKDSLDPEVVLIGNSITHFWGGLPLLRNAQGVLRQPNGPQSYANAFGQFRVLNLGFDWDRTQNVLWRLDNGELDGLHPRKVIIDIGTNNTSETPNARKNTPEEIVAGIDAVCRRVRSKVPGAHIVVMAVFPREKEPDNPRRLLITEINKLLKIYTEKNALSFVDIGPDMLEPDGQFRPGMMLDFTHPGEKGYEVWGSRLRDILAEP